MALGVSSWALFRPAKSATSADAAQPTDSTSYTAEQQAAANPKICAAATAGIPVTDPVQATRLKDADGMNTSIADLCK